MDGNRVKQGTMLDRISDLPNNVIDIILSAVPLRVAVQTSTLSKKWRIQWTRAENLVFDRNFFDDIFHGHVLKSAFNRYIFDDIGPEDKIMESKYRGIVGNILLSHSGPIRKFILYVPVFCHTVDAVNMWILAVLQHGVQDLKLDFELRICKVPSYVFQCMELKHLSLINLGCSSLPHNFGGLSSLLSLDLHCDVISGDLLTHIFLNCPLLEILSLWFHRMDGSCAVNASELKVLCLTCHRHQDFIFINTPNLSTVSLQFNGRPYESGHINPDMCDFVGAVPKLKKLTLTGAVLEKWGAKDIPKMLAAPLENNLSLIVYSWNTYSLAQVRSMFCLINSFPIMRTLDIVMCPPPDSQPHDTIDYLKSQIREAENLWSLRIARVTQLMGNEPEMIFIEIILTRCPMLEKLYLSSCSQISSDAELKMMMDIMRFRRASAQAEMIYSSRSSLFPDSVSSHLPKVLVV